MYKVQCTILSYHLITNEENHGGNRDLAIVQEYRNTGMYFVRALGNPNLELYNTA